MPKQPLYPHVPKRRETLFPHVPKKPEPVKVPPPTVAQFPPEFVEKLGVPEIYVADNIKWGRLVTKSYTGLIAVHIGKVKGESAWANGFMLEIKPVPERLKKLKGYEERGETTEGKPRDFTSLVPDYADEGIEATVLRRTVGITNWGEADPKSSIVFLYNSANEKVVVANAKYIDYFMKTYPDAKFIFGSYSRPILVQSAGKEVGVIMPIGLDEKLLRGFVNGMRGVESSRR